MSTLIAFPTPPLIHVCMQCMCRYIHRWPCCDGAEEERFNTLTGRLAVSVRTFPASSGWGKILVGVRVFDATYSIRLLLLTTCHGRELPGINSTPKIDSQEFNRQWQLSPQSISCKVLHWAGDNITYYDCGGGTALGLGAA